MSGLTIRDGFMFGVGLWLVFCLAAIGFAIGVAVHGRVF